MEGSGDVTTLLRELRDGNRSAEADLIPLVYSELRRIARGYMRRERENHTLQATELVNEAYLRLTQGSAVDWQSRAHFFAVASQVMRRILVDYARSRTAEKRGGVSDKVNIDDVQVALEIHPEELLDLDDALSRLKLRDPRQSRIVELRVFGGLTEEEIAELLSISSRTVKRDWRLARAWLYGEIKGGGDSMKAAGSG